MCLLLVYFPYWNVSSCLLPFFFYCWVWELLTDSSYESFGHTCSGKSCFFYSQGFTHRLLTYTLIKAMNPRAHYTTDKIIQKWLIKILFVFAVSHCPLIFLTISPSSLQKLNTKTILNKNMCQYTCFIIHVH